MTLSRREFLGSSALSASALVFNKLGWSEIRANASVEGRTGSRLVFSMNQGWQFFREDGTGTGRSTAAIEQMPPFAASWEKATLPHTVRLEKRDVSGGQNFQGICWYQRSFVAPTNWEDRLVYLKIQGAMQVADVWLNGVHMTTHFCGYLPFTVDLSNTIRRGVSNTIVVRLDNSDNGEVPPGKPQGELDFCYFGGLYRDVDLEVVSRLHISDPILANSVAGGGIMVSFPAVDEKQSTVQVQTDVANDSTAPRSCIVSHELIGNKGEVVARTSEALDLKPHSHLTRSQQLQVREAKLWHPEDPQLYWLHTQIIENGKAIDDQMTRIGIRSIEFDGKRGMIINGRPFFSIGANRHQDHPYVGYALPASAHYRDALKLRDAGFTSVRIHYPQGPGFMDACDELGILVIVSNPGWQFVGNEVFIKRVYQDAREMVRRDRNHPSVAIWEAALNESDNRPVAAELYRIVHEEMPGSGCYTAGDPIADQVKGFPGWDIDYVSKTGSTSGKPTWIREWGDQVDNWSDQQSRVRVARSWGESPMLVQASTHMASLDAICQYDPMPAGADLWAGIDAYRGYHHQPFMGGPLDLFRLPKFDYYMFQSQRPGKATAIRVGSGPMVFIANYASFQSPSIVTVFSNCEQVRMMQNGKPIATQKPDSGYHLAHPPFTFRVGEFSNTQSMLFSNGVAPRGTEIGELVAEGLIDGVIAARHVIHSPGVPSGIQMQVDLCGVDPVADGNDWVRVYARVCDARGTTHPFADDMVTFSVSGEGVLVGDGSIFANPVRAEAGIATALVRMTNTPGRITVHAASPGLKETLIEFESKPNKRSTF